MYVKKFDLICNRQDCPNGKLTKDKFVDLYKMFFAWGQPEKFCEHVFRTFDMDGNGYIDFKEFLLALAITSEGSMQERLKWAFRMYDINGDGHIEKPEMTLIVQALYEMLGPAVKNLPVDTPEQRTQVIFDKMDSNKDGCLTLKEFLNGCLEDPTLAVLLNVNPMEQ
ncbi:neuronal calcium sensor 2-like [Limulus polyphemus]|uniref:Neuronal calcium sensor 2-like n=1 Tax=Limulus polyphemus TaxID=6850 RepID=A0ABM1BZ46_LIMPO|nr:neuronal calcium sensor 2-like [Limulus polyphemus]